MQMPGYPAITVTMPAGWQSNGGPVKNEGTRSSLTLMPWIVGNITSDPCQWNSDSALSPSQTALLEPPVGPTVDDLATALANQPLRDATTPTDVTIDGYTGKSLELTIPADLDFATCSGGFFVGWVGPTADDTMGFATPGSHDRIWILDVEGVRLVLDAIDFPEASAQDRAELQGIVDSIQLEPAAPAPASPAPSTVAAPTAIPVPTFADRFVSPLHGYSVGQPAGWTPTPATLAWAPGAVNNWGTGIDDEIATDAARFSGASQALQPGQSVEQWLDLYAAGADRTSWPTVEIGGNTGYIDADGVLARGGTVASGGVMYDAVVIVDGRAYNFNMDGRVDRSVFEAFLATVQFVAAGADFPPPSP